MEIQNHLSGNTRRPSSPRLVEWLNMDYSDNEIADYREMFEKLGPVEIEGKKEQYLVPDPAGLGGNELENQTIEWEHIRNRYASLERPLTKELGYDSDFRREFVRFFCVRLDALTRLSLVRNQEMNDNYGRVKNYLDRLLRDHRLRETAREVVLKAFPNHHFLIDQNGERLQIRLGDENPPSGFEEQRGLEHAEKMGQYRRIDEYGDGVKAFVGMVAGIVALGQRFILIDDPEAFLHPPVARVFGQELADIANAREAQVIVSTHSPELVMGCLETSSKVCIVRLTYDDLETKATARQINPNTLKTLMRDRLLRSTGVFSGFFHRGVIVTESEEDRVFYDEINRRLVASGRGNRDTLFLNAQNWSTTGQIAGPLREIGVPTAVIVDVDVLRNPASEWKQIRKGCFLPSNIGGEIGGLASSIRKEISSDEQKQKLKERGLDFFVFQNWKESRGVASKT
jgi:hypothetical protein